jgi:hypothetical protein
MILALLTNIVTVFCAEKDRIRDSSMTNSLRLANMADIFSAVVVIGGIIFAVLQMRQTRQQRREMAAIKLFRSFVSPEFADACRTVLHFPESERCAMLICTTMESTSVMMYQRIVPAAVGYGLIGSTTIILWKKPEVWTNDLREEVDNRCTFEWFQWLAIQLKEMQNDSVRPAYESRGDWKLLNFGNEL